jgi:hypothetical protein
VRARDLEDKVVSKSDRIHSSALLLGAFGPLRSDLKQVSAQPSENHAPREIVIRLKDINRWRDFVH